MLSNKEFNDWCRRLNLPEAGRKVIEKIRTSEPVRQVAGGGFNVTGDYSSRKMGKTLQFESHKVELPGVEEYEDDPDVKECYDQPYRFTLKFQSKSGQTVTASHVPDFFVIRQNCAGFEEWKPEAKLEKLAIEQPNRYVRGEDSRWHSPPASEYAQQLGLYYRIRSDAEIDWIKYRNRQFLKAYTQQKYQITRESAAKIKDIVASRPGITYWELLQYEESSPDDINALIAANEVYVDLSAAALAKPERVYIFRDQPTAIAHSLLTQTSTASDKLLSIDPAIGSSFSWDGKWLTIVQIGETKIVLRSSDSLIQLTQLEFDKLVQLGEIISLKAPEQQGFSPESMERFLKASPEALAEANHRYRVIEPYLNGQSRENETVAERTVRDWKAKFRVAQQKYNWGYIGLIGNHTSFR